MGTDKLWFTLQPVAPRVSLWMRVLNSPGAHFHQVRGWERCLGDRVLLPLTSGSSDHHGAPKTWAQRKLCSVSRHFISPPGQRVPLTSVHPDRSAVHPGSQESHEESWGQGRNSGRGCLLVQTSASAPTPSLDLQCNQATGRSNLVHLLCLQVQALAGDIDGALRWGKGGGALLP